MFSTDFNEARLKRVLNYEDARRNARHVLPRAIFDYLDGAAADGVTLERNVHAFRDLTLRPRMGVWVDKPDVATTLFGQTIAMPVLTAPCGGMRLVHPQGDIGVAKGAAQAGVAHVLSSASGFSLEDVAAASPDLHWFQLYRFMGQEGMENLVMRAQQSGYKAIVITMDTQVVSKREKDWRNGFSYSMRINAANAIKLGPQLITRPFWLRRYIRDGMPFELANTAGIRAEHPALLLSQMVGGSQSPTWEDVAWVRNNFKGPVLVKGILTGDDARKAVDLGCDGAIVSNHGGRQLDGAPASMQALGEVVEAVGAQAEVLLDSGVRRGSDVVKALSLGAKAVLVGRTAAFGLAIGGSDGVAHMLELLRAEIVNALQLMGCSSVKELDKDWLMQTHSAVSTG